MKPRTAPVSRITRATGVSFPRWLPLGLDRILLPRLPIAPTDGRPAPAFSAPGSHRLKGWSPENGVAPLQATRRPGKARLFVPSCSYPTTVGQLHYSTVDVHPHSK